MSPQRKVSLQCTRLQLAHKGDCPLSSVSEAKHAPPAPANVSNAQSRWRACGVSLCSPNATGRFGIAEREGRISVDQESPGSAPIKCRPVLYRRSGEDYSVDRYWLPGGLRAVIGGKERASIGTDVNAEGLFLISINVIERATAPRQMAPAIIAPAMSPQVARSSIRGSCAFMLLSFHTNAWRSTQSRQPEGVS
jgi:hypothetical protein